MYEEVCYEKPFLKEVIARIDFVSPLEGVDKSLPSKLANVASESFPISEPTDGIAQELQFAGEEVRHTKTHFKQWNFFGKEREKQFSITPNFLSVSYFRYSTYEKLKADYCAVVNAVRTAFPDVRAARFGLRYINTIAPQGVASPIIWEQLIKADLIKTMAVFNQPDTLTRFIHVAELRHREIDIRFQFGLPNPDYPALIKRPLFVLDLDGRVGNAHNLSESLQYMDQAHERIQQLFEESITDQLREHMNAKPAVATNQ